MHLFLIWQFDTRSKLEEKEFSNMFINIISYIFFLITNLRETCMNKSTMYIAMTIFYILILKKQRESVLGMTYRRLQRTVLTILKWCGRHYLWPHYAFGYYPHDRKYESGKDDMINVVATKSDQNNNWWVPFHLFILSSHWTRSSEQPLDREDF